jgi:hypothetical protein
MPTAVSSSIINLPATSSPRVPLTYWPDAGASDDESARRRSPCGVARARRDRGCRPRSADGPDRGGLALQGGLLIARSPDPDVTRVSLGTAVDAMLRGGLAPRERR